MALSCIKIYVWTISIDSERKVTVYGPDKVNEIPEPLPDEFLTPTAPADRPPTAPDTGMCGIMWPCLLCFFILYRAH